MKNAILTIMLSVYIIVSLVEREIIFLEWSNNGFNLYIVLVAAYMLCVYLIFKDIDNIDR